MQSERTVIYGFLLEVSNKLLTVSGSGGLEKAPPDPETF
jgi:hypothetical protein